MLLEIYLYGGLCISMTKYPNREALRKAHDIYRDAMREFICQYLENRVQDETVEVLIMRALNREQHELIDIKGISNIFKNRECWDDFFSHKFGYDQRLGRNGYDIRSVTSLIVMGRNKVSHPGSRDLDPDYTNTHLFLMTEVLGEIGKTQAKYEVQDIWDDLCSDDTEEHPAEVEIANLKERLANRDDELKTEKEQHQDTQNKLTKMEGMEAEWLEMDERCKAASKELTDTRTENAELKERLSEKEDRLKTVESESGARIKTLLEQLRTVEAEKTELEEHLKNLRKQPKTSKTLEDRVEIGRKVAELRINAAGSKPLAWKKIREKLGLKNDEFHKVIRLEDHFKESVVERIESFEDGWEYDGNLEVLLGFKPVGELANRIKACKPAPNAPSPDSITFQGTTFTRHLNKYHVTEDDISQNFWHYWHSQGREGKQEMRDAGWSVEKVNGDWEVTISAENFQAWIEDEVSELSNLLNPSQRKEPSTQSTQSSYEKTSLPTGKEMVQPALRVLADGREHRRVEIINVLTEHFSLTKNQREQLSRSGKAEVYLRTNGLIEQTKTRYYRITDLGLEVLRRSPR